MKQLHDRISALEPKAELRVVDLPSSDRIFPSVEESGIEKSDLEVSILMLLCFFVVIIVAFVV